MNNTDKTSIRRPQQRPSVKIIIEREFIGDKTLAEAFIPIITEDLQRNAEKIRTIDNKSDTA